MRLRRLITPTHATRFTQNDLETRRAAGQTILGLSAEQSRRHARHREIVELAQLSRRRDECFRID